MKRPKITYFLDRCLPRRVEDALEALGCDLRRLDAEFEQDARDEDWLPVVAAKGWVVLTCDTRISRNKAELATLLAHEVKYFTLVNVKARSIEKARAFAAALPQIERMVRKRRRGCLIARITLSGAVHLKHPPSLKQENKGPKRK